MKIVPSHLKENKTNLLNLSKNLGEFKKVLVKSFNRVFTNILEYNIRKFNITILITKM